MRRVTPAARSQGVRSHAAPFQCHSARKKLKSPGTAAEKHRTKNAHFPHKRDVNGMVWGRQSLAATSMPL
jgi:hypothetical protein